MVSVRVLLALGLASLAPAAVVPDEFRGIYFSFWSAGQRDRIAELLHWREAAGVNAVVIDVKDSTGTVGYDSRLPEVARYGAMVRAIRDLDGLTRRLQQAGLYTIARVAVFEDPRLAQARPDLAVHRESVKGPLWRDHKGLSWIDPAAHAAWDYNIAIAQECLARGFDEVNFDYVRYPSDGRLAEMAFPLSGANPDRRAVLREFFAYVRSKLPDARLSADLFGLATVRHDDLGIGQVIEDAAPYFDYVCPMVYPSHYARGFEGFSQPAEHPYDVVLKSMKTARIRLARGPVPVPVRAKLRPWLQDFNMGAVYTVAMVQEQIQATRDALGPAYTGYVLWNPRNVYRVAAIGGQPAAWVDSAGSQ